MITEKDLENTVIRIFESSQMPEYPYHNLAHTESVVKHTKEIAAYYLLKEPERFILTAAAWFHDIGHLYGDMQDHEERGVLIMEYYLQSEPEERIAAISACIMATKSPSHPKDLNQQILCDADTYHFGTDQFRQTDILVEKEMEMRTAKKNPHWHKDSLKLLQQHVFFTDYCRDLLTEGKNQNIAWLESLV